MDTSRGRPRFRLAAFVGALTALALPGPAFATSSPPAQPTPPVKTAEPPETSPFDGPVGGDLLGTLGEVVVDEAALALPDVDAPCWLVADAGTGDVLAAKNAHKRQPPASTLKLLTALAALPNLNGDETYSATDAAVSVAGSRVGLVPNETYTVDEVLHGMFLSSGNDAAYALGEMVGGQEAIAELMNAYAAEIGAFDTHAVNSHGLDTTGQLTSAYDLALLGRAALNDDLLATLARTRTYDFPGIDGETFQVQNTNRLLGTYDGAIGIKNGYTTKAEFTLVAAAERDRRLIVVVMGTEDRAVYPAADLLDWGFEATSIEPVGTLVSPDDVAAAIETQQAANDQPDDAATPNAADTRPAGGGPTMSSSAMLSVAALAVALLMAIVMRRRSRRPTGRYAARR